MVYSWIRFQPLTPTDLIQIATVIIMLATAVIALFGPVFWQQSARKRKRHAIHLSLFGLLSTLKSDLERIRDDRQKGSNEWVAFSVTSMGEISHYSDLLHALIIPHIDVFKLPEDSQIFELFNRYQRNMGVLTQRAAKTKEEANPVLGVKAVNELIEQIESVLDGLQSVKKENDNFGQGEACPIGQIGRWRRR